MVSRISTQPNHQINPISTMNKHKYNIWPQANEEDFNLIVQDMRDNGFDTNQPITLFEGAILDGWNRWLASQESGVKPMFTTFSGTHEEALLYTLRTNKRRNLTSSQRAALARESEGLLVEIAEEAQKRMKAGVAPAPNPGQKIVQGLKDADGIAIHKTHPLHPDFEQNIKRLDEHATKTATKAAELFNTNRTYINQAARIQEKAPQDFERIKAGELTIPQAMKSLAKEEKKAERTAMIEEQKKAIESGEIKLPEGVFEVIAMDPPWHYGREYDPDSSRVANPYPEMTQEQLLALQPPFAEDCVLFLWTTHAFIFDAKELLEKWGFNYKATMVWDKEKIGMGAWLRMQCEFCLVAIKGKPTWVNTTWRDIIREPRREHSRKPDTFYEMVESITVGRRLEYFSREQREGWTTYGNDTEKF
jgi:N6-adenosine-specific RNA methylase IME4/anti-sigma28 factor (negative regulator of flagellin synthesis)